MPNLFYGEADGARVIALSNDLTQVTEDGTEEVLMAVEYHELWPAGSAGDVILRELTPIVRTNNGATYRVTPIVDGVVQTPQAVTVTGAVTQPASIYPLNSDTVRGSRISALVEQVEPRTGDFELIDVGYALVVIRRTP